MTDHQRVEISNINNEEKLAKPGLVDLDKTKQCKMFEDDTILYDCKLTYTWDLSYSLADLPVDGMKYKYVN